MKTIRYVCIHCGRRFEAEEKENIECPACFWSTSVKKEEDAPQEPQVPRSAEKEKTTFSWGQFSVAFSELHHELKKFIPLVAGIFGVVLVVAVIVGAWPLIKNVFHKKASIDILEKPIDKESSAELVPQAPGASPLVVINPADKEILSRKLEISANRAPDEGENKILNFHAPFQTGYQEKLPSQIWTVKQFDEMLASQEKYYKITLPWSYRRNLMKLFKKTYLASQPFFEKDDILHARNLWVESLAFPIYANDIPKHRGVVLTMLRPFINDTLSKIGVANRVLGERITRDQEIQVNERYQKFLSLISQKAWPQALASAADLEKAIQDLEKSAKNAVQLPQYPQAVNAVDDGIRPVLYEILTPAPTALSDIGPLRQDIAAKKKVVRSFVPAELQASLDHYNRALDAIQQEDWGGARTELEQVEMPALLVKDAKEKIVILEKIDQPVPVPGESTPSS